MSWERVPMAIISIEKSMKSRSQYKCKKAISSAGKNILLAFSFYFRKKINHTVTNFLFSKYFIKDIDRIKVWKVESHGCCMNMAPCTADISLLGFSYIDEVVDLSIGGYDGIFDD